MIGLLAYGVYVPRLRLQCSAVFIANGWFNRDLAGVAKGEGRNVRLWSAHHENYIGNTAMAVTKNTL
jgi:hypothetical protein